eukprot:14418141-Alexandrium_andersonii.AAC.1
MAHSAGRASAGPRAWPLPPPRDGSGVGAGPAVDADGAAPPLGRGRVAFVDLAAAFNRGDLAAHRVSEGVDPPT